MATDLGTAERTISGLDALDLGDPGRPESRLARIWASTWPKLLALAFVLALWQVVYWSGWREPWVLPAPSEVFADLGRAATTASFWHAIATTLRRGLVGFALAAAIGLVLGVAVARVRPLRAALGSAITALQTMPSIAWFPLAILLFQISENAILFVVVLGAAPSIANGVISGVDYVPPLLLRAGRNFGARGLSLYRHVVAPASLPAIVSGLKQGWAFAWRSLLAGELLVIIAHRPALGVRLQGLREQNDAVGVLSTMIVIFVLGVVADAVFSYADRRLRRSWGLDQA
ncbi:ABC transporter permease [Planosporangium sp. 12N6]|uniref:ABC transporter permease n=1 Tax=Planosporangium spinosum TaxID=3402278 RepID=UPI003CFB3A8F